MRATTLPCHRLKWYVFQFSKVPVAHANGNAPVKNVKINGKLKMEMSMNKMHFPSSLQMFHVYERWRTHHTELLEAIQIHLCHPPLRYETLYTKWNIECRVKSHNQTLFHSGVFPKNDTAFVRRTHTHTMFNGSLCRCKKKEKTKD